MGESFFILFVAFWNFAGPVLFSLCEGGVLIKKNCLLGIINYNTLKRKTITFQIYDFITHP